MNTQIYTWKVLKFLHRSLWEKCIHFQSPNLPPIPILRNNSKLIFKYSLLFHLSKNKTARVTRKAWRVSPSLLSSLFGFGNFLQLPLINIILHEFPPWWKTLLMHESHVSWEYFNHVFIRLSGEASLLSSFEGSLPPPFVSSVWKSQSSLEVYVYVCVCVRTVCSLSSIKRECRKRWF